MAKIVYTKTDEAPALATGSLLPVIKGFLSTADVAVEVADISLATRILAQFLPEAAEDALAKLGGLVKGPTANIIKLPNISASIPQLKSAISELQEQGFAIPNFPESPQDGEQQKSRDKYAKVLGSAVNPVLRQGNSDRRVAPAVKNYARANPHSMGKWESSSRTHVAHMKDGDFFSSEQSLVIAEETTFTIEFVTDGGESKILREAAPLQKGEVIDSAVMNCQALKNFFKEEIESAKRDDILLSLHLKATMMKVSDPIIFGHALESFLAPLFEQHRELLEQVGANPRNGLSDLYTKIEQLPSDKKTELEKIINDCFKSGPKVAMVDSDKGITNFHVPSDVIIDASMPACIRGSGKMWATDGKPYDTKALIPDRCYAGIYQRAINFCRENGAFDPTTMGSVSNVGLMGQKAEEYGSHDKTFEIASAGIVRVVDGNSKVLMEHKVYRGDIFRMCQTKDIIIRDWVRLSVERARAQSAPVIFWLNDKRAHDKNLIAKVREYLPSSGDISGLEIEIMAPEDAIDYTMKRSSQGKDTISATGNVLRDYLTDLFPILELGTSAKMLSIVPLIGGGGLYETGAGGSAPKHVQQLLEENHLRWDSLGEFLALQVSLEELGRKENNKRATLLSSGLGVACDKYLQNNKAPQRKVKTPDNRCSHFYLALYWAQALAEQQEDAKLKEIFAPIAQELSQKEEEIVAQTVEVQGKAVDIGGYYLPSEEKVASVMRPSTTFNKIIDSLRAR